MSDFETVLTALKASPDVAKYKRPDTDGTGRWSLHAYIQVNSGTTSPFIQANYPLGTTVTTPDAIYIYQDDIPGRLWVADESDLMATDWVTA